MATFIGTIHILAASAFVGGAILMIFGSRMAAKEDPALAPKMNMIFGSTFMTIAWAALATLVLTGMARAAALGAFSPENLATNYGRYLIAKIVLVAVIIVIAVLISRARTAMGKAASEGGASDKMAALGGRIGTLSVVNVVLGVIVLALAVGLRVIGIENG